MSFLDNITARLPIGKSSPKEEYFFALNIGLTEVSAALWGLVGHKLDIIGKSSISYEDTNDLIVKASQALDEALGALDIEPQKILFGVPDSWNLDDNLKEPYLKLLRKMVKEFELEPMAYVTTSHAISHLIQKQEGIPPTALLIGIGEFIECILLRGGKVIASGHVKKSSAVFEDIEKALSQFTDVEVLPSKVMLYSTVSGLDLTRIKEDFMSYPWMQRLSFLHLPKVIALEPETIIQAIVLAGAIELDPDVNFVVALPAKRKTVSSLHRLDDIGGGPNSLGTEEDLGFVAGDITQRDNAVLEDESEESETPGLSGPDIEADSQEKLEDEEDEDLSPAVPALRKMSSKLPQTAFEEDTAYPPMPLPRRDSSIVETNRHGVPGTGLTAMIASYLEPLKSIFDFHLPGKFAVGPVVAIPVVLVGLFLAYFFLVKAEVTVYVDPKTLEKSAEVVADPLIAEVDKDKKIIPAQTVSVSVKASGSAAATGEKEIGDPAKGQVVIYNKTSSPRTFSQGAVLVGPNSLKFTLDSTVNVASQSTSQTDEGAITKFGKATANVTASAIGPDSNLSADQELSFQGLDANQYNAKVDQALSGGTSKMVTIVTADDQKKLKARVLDELKVKAKEEMAQKVTDDQKIITDALTITSEKYKYSKSPGDQAKEFVLDATVEFSGTSYSDANLKMIVSSLVETNVPEGYMLNLSDTETTAEVSEIKKDGTLVFVAKFRANLMPRIDEEMLKNKIKGKRIAQAGESLKEVEHVLGSEILLKPPLPGPIGFLPLRTENINIYTTTK